jgi:hypothetical protein
MFLKGDVMAEKGGCLYPLNTETNMKICSHCLKEQDISEFLWRKHKSCYEAFCQSCRKKATKAYRERRSEHLKEKAKEWEQNNKELIKETKRLYRKNNPDKIKAQNLKWRDWRKVYSKTYYEENKEDYARRYQDNFDKIKEGKKLRRQVRKDTDANYRLRLFLGSHAKKVKISSASDSVNEYLGCSIPFLREHIERQFDPNMSWENYGTYWHIDHILCLSSFSFINDDGTKNEENIKIACNWRNLRPLEKHENLHKRASIVSNYAELRQYILECISKGI